MRWGAAAALIQGFLWACNSGIAQAQTLADLQARAVAADPAVQSAQATRRAAEQRVVQAHAAFGPNANITVSTSQTRYRELPTNELRPFRGDQAALQVNQPLWRGALVPAAQAARSQLEQADAALAQARMEAQLRLIEALLEVFKSQDVMSHAKALLDAQQAQLAVTRRTFQVGRAAVTDLREAEAKVDSALAQRLAAEAELDLRQQVLAEVAAGPVTELLVQALAQDGLPPAPTGGLVAWLANAEAGSLQIQQASHALLSAEADIRKASLAHAPSLDLNYSYTRSNDTGTATSIFPRRGNSSVVGATLTIPLFASGATQSKVIEAQALRDKAQAELESARRTLAIGVRQAFVSALSATAQAHALSTAMRSQALSVRANQRGYELGLRINSDVLEAQSKLFEAQRDHSRARHEAWAQHFKLRMLAGQLGETDLQQLETQLVPRQGGDVNRSPVPDSKT